MDSPPPPSVFGLWSLQYWSKGSQILVQFIFYSNTVSSECSVPKGCHRKKLECDFWGRGQNPTYGKFHVFCRYFLKASLSQRDKLMDICDSIVAFASENTAYLNYTYLLSLMDEKSSLVGSLFISKYPKSHTLQRQGRQRGTESHFFPAFWHDIVPSPSQSKLYNDRVNRQTFCSSLSEIINCKLYYLEESEWEWEYYY